MSFEDWKDKISNFRTIDVRGTVGNFFPGLKKQAEGIAIGEGVEVIQSFEPVPLYDIMEQSPLPVSSVQGRNYPPFPVHL